MENKAVILDMYGVILKDPGEGFYTFVNRTFPNLSPKGDLKRPVTSRRNLYKSEEKR